MVSCSKYTRKAGNKLIKTWIYWIFSISLDFFRTSKWPRKRYGKSNIIKKMLLIWTLTVFLLVMMMKPISSTAKWSNSKKKQFKTSYKNICFPILRHIILNIISMTKMTKFKKKFIGMKMNQKLTRWIHMLKNSHSTN